jgi:outer membrane beta-barrel protein
MSEGRQKMGTTTTTTRTAKARRLLVALAAGLGLLTLGEQAQAQEILLTGPLAGAPAVRQLRLYREGRFEIAPAATFTLLDEYQRTIMFGGRLNYNFTDWLAFGVWGTYGAIKIKTALSDHIQEVNDARQTEPFTSTNRRLTAVNMSRDFRDQLTSIDWIVAPQLTGVPFRGKLALFQSIYVDTDLYFFVGPAFVGLTERSDCETQCSEQFAKKSRVAIGPTFGLGFSFYINKWNAIGFEWRAVPFPWNPAGFDTAGGGKDEDFPDNKITSADQQFKFNQMLTVSYNFYLPTEYRVSE